VRSLAARELDLWLQAPVVDLTIDTLDTAAGPLTITAQNVLPDAALTGDVGIAPLGGPRPTVRSWTVELPPGRTVLRIAPPDALDTAPWRFAVMGDIQDALPTVDEVFATIDAQQGLRFVISTGDIVHRGREDEWRLFEQQLTTLDLPFYSTIGNHELWGHIDRWYRRFGRATVHFDYRGVAFSLVDSASAGIDPLVDAELDTWLAEHTDGIHVFGTHYPPLDPVGVRMGSFASRREAEALLARLAAARVDVTFYGHIHTYTGFENAGIPAYISGGGGAEPMRLDGIDRHFLVADVDPAAGRITDIAVVRVDE
jgi:predicted phosphodiesterase